MTTHISTKPAPLEATVKSIEWVLTKGTEHDRGSLLTYIERLCGPAERLRVEQWATAERQAAQSKETENL